MQNYPPAPFARTRLQAACEGIESAAPGDPWGALAGFFETYAPGGGGGAPCFNLSAQMPSGANATISAGDWSGVGSGDDGERTAHCVLLAAAAAAAAAPFPRAQSHARARAHTHTLTHTHTRARKTGSSWDFETCYTCVQVRFGGRWFFPRPSLCAPARSPPRAPPPLPFLQPIGTNGVTDMFLPRAFSYEWQAAHCQSRFNMTPQPRVLPELWGTDEAALPRVTSHVVFTNGLNDGWSVGGVLRNLSDTLLSFSMPNGAHHSDLNYAWPSKNDTPDVLMTRELVAQTLERWLAGK